MNMLEKNLYQQIHPARLTTDWVTGLYACYLLWHQEMVPAIVVAFLPSLVVSLFIVRFVDLNTIKQSSFGRYYKRTYSKTVDLIRFAGFVLMAAGAWINLLPVIGAGLAVIIGTWTYGLFFKREK